MKQLLLIPSFLSLLIFPAMAQVKVGVKAGGNYSNATIPNFKRFNNPEFKTGFHAGFFLLIPAGKDIYVKQELFYNLKGWKNTDSLAVEKVHLKYLSQTLLLGIKANPKLSLLMGPEVGYLLDVGPEDNGPNIPEADILDTGAFNRLEVGFCAGISYQALENLHLEARYVKGLTHLFNWRMFGPPYYYGDGNNKVIQVSLGYTFGKKPEKTDRFQK